jgi:hypothetical protein
VQPKRKNELITRRKRATEVTKLIQTGRPLEGAVSTAIRNQLNMLGIKSYKVSDKFTSGIPDIYMCNGMWIESKVISRAPTKNIQPVRHLSSHQRRELNDLTRHGDQCFVAMYFQFSTGNNNAFVLCPWWEFWRISLWDLDAIVRLGKIVRGASSDFDLKRFFHKDHPLIFDPKIWWDGAFESWVNDNPDKFDADRRPGRFGRPGNALFAGEPEDLDAYVDGEDDEPEDQ